jgi:hypothetical protein
LKKGFRLICPKHPVLSFSPEFVQMSSRIHSYTNDGSKTYFPENMDKFRIELKSLDKISTLKNGITIHLYL